MFRIQLSAVIRIMQHGLTQEARQSNAQHQERMVSSAKTSFEIAADVTKVFLEGFAAEPAVEPFDVVKLTEADDWQNVPRPTGGNQRFLESLGLRL